MNKFIKTLFAIALLLVSPLLTARQVEMADNAFRRQNLRSGRNHPDRSGGLVFYLFMIDRKVKKLENWFRMKKSKPIKHNFCFSYNSTDFLGICT